VLTERYRMDLTRFYVFYPFSACSDRAALLVVLSVSVLSRIEHVLDILMWLG